VNEKVNIDICKIKELIELVNSSSLSALEIQDGSLKIRLEKASDTAALSLTNNSDNVLANPAPVPAAAAVSSNSKEKERAGKAEEAAMEETDYKVIRAPMVGAFHHLPSADIGPGTRMKKGDSVCIIEAMKLMNEITMEEDGEIISIEAREGEMVEYGQVLVKYR